METDSPPAARKGRRTARLLKDPRAAPTLPSRPTAAHPSARPRPSATAARALASPRRTRATPSNVRSAAAALRADWPTPRAPPSGKAVPQELPVLGPWTALALAWCFPRLGVRDALLLP